MAKAKLLPAVGGFILLIIGIVLIVPAAIAAFKIAIAAIFILAGFYLLSRSGLFRK